MHRLIMAYNLKAANLKPDPRESLWQRQNAVLLVPALITTSQPRRSN